jgi:hypothetical protein
MTTPRYPSLFQINTRVRLAELSAALGRPATLDDITDAELDALAADGFDLVWFLGVWQTGEAGHQVSASNPEWLAEYHRVLPDFQEPDVSGSCFAICDYHVHTDFGGDKALAILRERLRQRGLRLILDFVPNHVAPDHHWIFEHPDFFITGTEEQLASQPQNYCRLEVAGESRILAYGRDPYFAGWPDTLQLNYGNPQLQQALFGELRRIAGQCDGVRCDMAMLVLPEVFERTWGIASAPFWPRVTQAIHSEVPGFLFMAEVYWDLEWTLQQQGFDYTYDKRLYDRLREGHARPVREHLCAAPAYQDKLARFLENHDEPRAAATFTREVHEAAAVITFLSPGLRFFHQGQFAGRRHRISPHLVRGPIEPPDLALQQFYDRLLGVLRQPILQTDWRLLECVPAWDGNWTWEGFIAFAWQSPGGQRLLVTVNYAGNQGQCYVRLPFTDLAGRSVRFKDHMGPASYDRDGNDVLSKGLYLDLLPWNYHVFEMSVI